MMSVNDLLGQFSISGLTEDMQEVLLENAAKTVAKLSELLSRFGEERKLTSGYRPPSYNKQVGGSPTSKHLTCQAGDLEDNDKALGEWCYNNLGTLRELGLSMESLSYVDSVTGELKGTHSGFGGLLPWVHLQVIPPPSGHTVFIP